MREKETNTFLPCSLFTTFSSLKFLELNLVHYLKKLYSCKFFQASGKKKKPAISNCLWASQVGLLYCSHLLSHVLFFATPWTIALQSALFMGFSKQEYWSGLLFPNLGDPPYPGIQPVSLVSSALAGVFFTTVSPGKQPDCHVE